MTDTINGMTMTFSPQAKQVINRMHDRVHELRAWYGEDHATTTEAERSLLNVLVRMIGLGGRYWIEGDPEETLSLYGANEFIYFGVIFHQSDYPERVVLQGGQPITGAPRPGSWSIHS